jgi:D-alanyl-D-alanine carboxypeptidase
VAKEKDVRRSRWALMAGAAIVAGAIAISSTAGAAPAAPAGHPAQQHRYGQADLQRDLDAIIGADGPGVLARIESRSRVLTATSGLADLDKGGAVDPDGFFRIGSNTKPFVATVVLQLVGERRLSLADPVDKWLPGVVSGNGNDGTAITVRQLLQHTSGIFDYTDDLVASIDGPESYEKFRLKQFDTADLIADAMSHEPYFAPGQGFNYSNTNYVLLGKIIQKVTGHDWATEVTRRIIRPLGLRHTFWPDQASVLPQPHASAYQFFTRTDFVRTDTETTTWADAAGSLVSTAPDLARFWTALGRGLLLRPAQQREMRQTVLATEFQDDQPGARYGLGLGQTPLSCGGFYYGHDGDVPGFSTVSGVSADGRTTVVVNMSTSADGPLHQAAWTLLDHAFCQHA